MINQTIKTPNVITMTRNLLLSSNTFTGDQVSKPPWSATRLLSSTLANQPIINITHLRANNHQMFCSRCSCPHAHRWFTPKRDRSELLQVRGRVSHRRSSENSLSFNSALPSAWFCLRHPGQ